MPPTATTSTRRAGRSAQPARPIVVAIDGPAGAGKSTVAKGVARALGFEHLDTGAMYRAVTARALDQAVDLTDGEALGALAREMVLDLGPRGIAVDGLSVGREIRTRRVSQNVSAVSAHRPVRRELVRVQRTIMDRGNVVAEGRDIGTVVYPRAPVKIFLTASVEERARRRHREMVREGAPVSFPTLKRELARRDALDSTRAVSPLTPAPDAVVVDSTGKTPRRVVSEIVALAKEVQRGKGPARTKAR